MSATAYLLVCRSTVDGRALGIDVFSEPSPTTCGPVRWTLAERPYAKTTGVDYETAVLRLRRAMRRDTEPWPDDLREYVQQFLEPLTADAFGPFRGDGVQRHPTLAERFLAESPKHSRVADRVDAWLEAHADWLAKNTDASKLAGQWREVCRRYGPASAPALGVLLGLVRMAFSDPIASSSATSPTRWVCRVGGLDETVNEVLLEYRGASEVEALLAALEDAPC